MNFSFKSQLALSASALMLATAFNTASFGVAGAQEAAEDEVVTIGSRRKSRSSTNTPAPVDVINGDALLNNASSDISDLLRTVVPSYNVNTQPISDAATIVRPANLRGLSPDNVLVLLNGKRRHRAAVIAFLGGGISDGAQGPDIGVFPAIGLKQVEVLRDGASSQYGSDAIAGVINFVLKDDREGGSFEVKYGSTYEGDGGNYQISGNIGLPLGEDGFVNISAEYGETNATVRSAERDDVAALIAAGNTDILDISVNTLTTSSESVQIWGQPNVNNDWKVFVNSGYEISDNMEVYAFGNFAQRQVEGGFFFRNPTNRGGVYEGPEVDPVTGAASSADDAVASVLVGNVNGLDAAACPAGIPLTGTDGLIPDPTVLAQVVADDNCFSFVEIAPGGFVPRFGGDAEDIAIVAGVRGELGIGSGLGYDVSYSFGTNQVDFFINNTINASLGANTPRDFYPGSYEQTDHNVNLDLTYEVPVEAFASDLSIAGGFEYRSEQFAITQGDETSFQLGPLSQPTAGFPNGQGFSSSSNGFGGFTQSTSDTQSNIAFYTELEADVLENLTVQVALRWEDYNTFGSTFNWKIGALYSLTDDIGLRATYSTGFHAPTPGQANVTNITTQFDAFGNLADQGTLPLSSNAGQLVNSTLADPFTLSPEDAKNFAVGMTFAVGPANVTVDYFNISVANRIAITDQLDFRVALATFGVTSGLNLVTDLGLTDVDGDDAVTIADASSRQTSQLLNALDANLGTFNIADFAGSEDLNSFGFFANDFDTKTQGFDVVANMPFELFGGDSSVLVALNYTNTSVTRAGRLSATRIIALEDQLPTFKGNVAFKHQQGIWRGLVRANFHGKRIDTQQANPTPFGGEVTVDLELAATVYEGVDLIVGANNLFNNFPDINPGGGDSGQLYSENAPFGLSGGQWYVKARYTF